jgi:hypothetical protein
MAAFLNTLLARIGPSESAVRQVGGAPERAQEVMLVPRWTNGPLQRVPRSLPGLNGHPRRHWGNDVPGATDRTIAISEGNGNGSG